MFHLILLHTIKYPGEWFLPGPSRGPLPFFLRIDPAATLHITPQFHNPVPPAMDLILLALLMIALAAARDASGYLLVFLSLSF